MIYEQIAQTKAFNYIKSNTHNTNKSQEKKFNGQDPPQI